MPQTHASEIGARQARAKSIRGYAVPATNPRARAISNEVRRLGMGNLMFKIVRAKPRASAFTFRRLEIFTERGREKFWKGLENRHWSQALNAKAEKPRPRALRAVPKVSLKPIVSLHAVSDLV